MKILFVCSANTQRSPAFEREFKKVIKASKNFKDWEVKSAGVWYGYPNRLTPVLMEWADTIYVMDLSHKIWINKRYPKYLFKVKIIGISDQYDTDSPELKELFNYWIKSLDPLDNQV